MSFTEWYKQKYKDNWHEDYAGLYSFATKMIEEYEHYCKTNECKPIWNG